MNSALRTKNYALIAGITLLLAFAFATPVVADRGSRAYNYYTGAGTLPPSDCAALGLPTGCTLCDIAPCPDVATASNGDTVTISGSGTLTIHPDSVTGSGTFVHKDSAGNVKASGTWTALSLMSFVSFGSGSAQGLPSDLEGGKAVILVHLSAGPNAVFTVVCALGSPPSGFAEGIRLNVQDIINFNKQVSGVTLLIRTA